MNITTHTKAIEIRKLAQTLLALHGGVDKISQIKKFLKMRDNGKSTAATK